MKAYDIAKSIMSMNDEEIEAVLDELATNWPNSYKQLYDVVQENFKWHMGEE